MENRKGEDMLKRLDALAEEALEWLDAFFKSGDETGPGIEKSKVAASVLESWSRMRTATALSKYCPSRDP